MMAIMSEDSLRRRVSALSLTFVAMIMLILGIVLLGLSSDGAIASHRFWSSMSGLLGGALFTTAMIGLVWDFIGKRLFFDEVHARLQLKNDIVKSGVSEMFDFNADKSRISWEVHISNSRCVYVLQAYGNRWIGENRRELRKLANSGATVYVILPDYRSESKMQELAGLFGMEPEKLEAKIREAEGQWRDIFMGGSTKLNIRLSSTLPLFSAYLFDGTSIMCQYVVGRDRSDCQTPVPCCVAGEGWMHNYVERQVKLAFESGHDV
jgi:hypothetical protein